MNPKTLLLSIVLCFGIGFSLFLMLTTPEDNEPPSPSSAVSSFLKQPHFQQFDPQGNLHFSLRSTEVQYRTQRNTAELKNPHLLVFTQDRIFWLISADYGVSEGLRTTNKNTNEERIYLSGHVVLHRPAQPQSTEITIRTSALTVYPTNSFAETPRHVTITQPGMLIQGQGIIANLKTNTIKLLKHSRGTYEAPDHS